MNLYGVTDSDVYAAMRAERTAGRIAPSVSFKLIREFTPRTGGVATEVQLEAYIRDRGRRQGNSGAYGAGDNYAATYDEWGWLLAALYAEHPDMLCGSPSYPNYRDAEDFHHQTGWTYKPELAEVIRREGDPFPTVGGRRCVGRRGANRIHYDDPRGERWGKPDPRTAEWAVKFYAGEVH